tara:strand:- start:694 stop:1803 length:1110 start_codon:yes stop_codon:yes gene_type:complete
MVDLILQLFSSKKGSMRAFRWYRVRQVMFLVPLFTTLLVLNNVSLALDWILFPSFRKQVIKRPVFIVSLPRTGTTNVFHALNSPGMPFSSMALWECLIAPSIIQRKVIRWVWRRLPVEARNAVFKFDKRVFGQLNTVHKTSLFFPEEDELVLMWSLSTIYVGLFYPESEVLRELFQFDELVSTRRKASITKRYRRLVQRHLYALGASEDVRFLSKNPAMAGKVESIAQHFPNGQSVVIDRPPNSILPSTELLFSIQLQSATDVKISKKERHAIYVILEGFRRNLQTQLIDKACMPYTVLAFSDLVQAREASINALLLWLDCSAVFHEPNQIESNRSKKNYVPLSDAEIERILYRPWPTWPKDKFLDVTL